MPDKHEGSRLTSITEDRMQVGRRGRLRHRVAAAWLLTERRSGDGRRHILG
jgi:hypothetical protein